MRAAVSQQAPPRPVNGDGLGVGTTEAVETETQGNDILSALAASGKASRGLPPPESYPKRLARVCAQYALAGYELYPLQDESLLFARSGWGMHRVLKNLEEAELLLVKIGGSLGNV